MRSRTLCIAPLVGSAVLLSSGGVASAGSPISQSYRCSAAGIAKVATATVSGTATIVPATKGNDIQLSNVVFSVSNGFGVTATGRNFKVHVPDPNRTKAPYILKSANVATTPAGWTANHDGNGAYAAYVGTITIPNGGTVTSAALGALYTDKGATGTVISFLPGTITFNLQKPVAAPVTCTPVKPVASFAQVTE